MLKITKFLNIFSYDDKLRIYSMSLSIKPEEEDQDEEVSPTITIKLMFHLEMHLGGAVWRTAWLPSTSEDADENEYRVLVAAARNGIQIVSFNKSSWTWNTVLKCEKHLEKLAYGVDYSLDKKDG